jgi:hypothetical protein
MTRKCDKVPLSKEEWELWNSLCFKDQMHSIWRQTRRLVGHVEPPSPMPPPLTREECLAYNLFVGRVCYERDAAERRRKLRFCLWPLIALRQLAAKLP